MMGSKDGSGVGDPQVVNDRLSHSQPRRRLLIRYSSCHYPIIPNAVCLAWRQPTAGELLTEDKSM